MTCTILVADADANIRSVLEYRLQREGYTVLLCGNCSDALEMAEAQKTDLIVLDLALPEPKDSGLCEQLLSQAAAQGIPVLALTIYGSDAANGTGREPKVLRTIQKPFSARQLVADINDILGRPCGESGWPS